MYVYGAKLEIASRRFLQRADFVTYISFICGVILVSGIIIVMEVVFLQFLSMDAPKM